MEDPLLPSTSQRNDDDLVDVEAERVSPVKTESIEDEEVVPQKPPQKKKNWLQRLCGFEVRFFICTVSCVLCYGVVQAYNYNSETVVLERNYFVAPQPLEECCCWKPNQCYVSWPDANDANVTVNASLYPACRSGCKFADTQQPSINLTADQISHLDCNANASTTYGLDRDEWGYNLPRVAPNASESYLKVYCDLQNSADIVAANIAGIPYDVGVALSPFLGILLDRIGGTALIMTITPAGFAVAHIILGLFRDVPALVPLLIQGTAYSFYSAALWAPVAHVMPEDMQGVG